MNAFSSVTICIRINVLLTLSETQCCWALNHTDFSLSLCACKM